VCWRRLWPRTKVRPVKWFKVPKSFRVPEAQKTYQTIVQAAWEAHNVESSPAISMGPHLLATSQLPLLRTISIYSERGSSAEQFRLLHMNAQALSVWREMGNHPNIIGSSDRPPRSALLAFGVPFSV
jgi:hypothetical protein